MKTLAGKKLINLMENEKEMLLNSGYSIMIEDEKMYIDFDIGVYLELDIKNLKLKKEVW